MTSFNPLAGVNPSDPFGIRTDFGDVKTASSVTPSHPTQMLTIPPPPDSPPRAPSSPPHPWVVELSDESLKNVKIATIRLLTCAIRKYREEVCYGCIVNHPSQMQHECIWETPEFYFATHYDEIVKILWTPRFIPAVRLFLCATSSLWESRNELTTPVNIILTELLPSANIEQAMNDIFLPLMSEDGDASVKYAHLGMIEHYWSGRHML
ncbi:uncharacterized protein LOC115793650 [Archocentrus centrarchus]|uniref:uncharacterized protein LOC115777440 n=1 Tax=Archocentrus centrarchus TaxID=63155 RepID=UPI0011EA1017|nr:uncharacterized protein LOC115777440 [Archocentrus centrarchus]XP_030604535.1 uncharacterized protein LOC115793630 isoform X2 [Archocentrus centrarchus]XP_030604576.1 uncharacterized protein LOC115793650 [Archocentrus centrarchus]